MIRKGKPKKVAKQAARSELKKKREGPLTLYPLDFDVAMRGIVGIASRTKDGTRRSKANPDE